MARLQGFPDRFIFRGTMQSIAPGWECRAALPGPARRTRIAGFAGSCVGPSAHGYPHRVTYQVTAKPASTHDVLLAWRKRTGHHCGISELIATILSGTNLKGPEAPTNPDVDLVPQLYLPTKDHEPSPRWRNT